MRRRDTLPGEWFTTQQIAYQAGMRTDRAARLLKRLHKAGVVARTVRGDGAAMWRIPADAILGLKERNG